MYKVFYSTTYRFRILLWYLKFACDILGSCEFHVVLIGGVISRFVTKSRSICYDLVEYKYEVNILAVFPKPLYYANVEF